MWDKIKRWRWAIAIVALLVGGIGYSLWPEAVPVDAGQVSEGPMSVGITDDGITRAEDVFVVSAPVSGYISRIELEPGDQVARGTIITKMTGQPSTPLDKRSRDELRGALAAARAVEKGAVSSLAQAKRDLARAQEIAKRGFLSRAQLEDARTRVSMGTASVLQSRAEVRRIQAMLADTSGIASGSAVPVRAPATGQVLTVLTESEGVVSQGAVIMEIGDPGQIEVVVDLLSREAVRAKPGDRVEITQWGGDKPLIGRVERVEPFGKLKISALGIEEQRVNVIIDFDAAAAKQAARLGHGYQIDATIILWSKEDALRVPIGALFRGGDGEWRVFIVDGGRAIERAIKVGHINDEYAEVLEGLEEGNDVVLNPGNALSDGSRIKLR